MKNIKAKEWSVFSTGRIDKLKEGKKKVTRPPNPKGSKGGTRGRPKKINYETHATD